MNSTSFSRLIATLAVIAGSVVLSAGLALGQTTHTVTTTADSGAGSLRAAIAAAADNDTVNFGLTTPATIELESEIDIAADITIDGPGGGNVTITNADTFSSRAFVIDGGETVTINGLSFFEIGGAGVDTGGAIKVDASTLTLDDCDFNAVTAEQGSVPLAGGAVWASGSTLNVMNCSVTAAVLSLDTVSALGGGIYALNTALTVDSTFFLNGNASAFGIATGGGIYIEGGATISTITGCSFNACSADNLGGGIYFTSSTGSLTIDKSYFYLCDTPGSSGGGIRAEHDGSLTLRNTFVVSCSAQFNGGGLSNGGSGTTLIDNCTFTLNNVVSGGGNGGGLSVVGGTVSTRNTIYSGNTQTGSSSPDIFGTVTSLGGNYLGDTTGSSGITDDVSNDHAGDGAATFTTRTSETGIGSTVLEDFVLLLYPDETETDIIDGGVAGGPADDFTGATRDASPDMGALEQIAAFAITDGGITQPTAIGNGGHFQTVMLFAVTPASDTDVTEFDLTLGLTTLVIADITNAVLFVDDSPENGIYDDGEEFAPAAAPGTESFTVIGNRSFLAATGTVQCGLAIAIASGMTGDVAPTLDDVTATETASISIGAFTVAVADPPTVAITSSETSPTNASPIGITVTFSEDVTGFDVSDLTIGNGSADNFASTSASVYTFDLTPADDGTVTVDIATDAAVNAGDVGNAPATQFSIESDTSVPTVTINVGASQNNPVTISDDSVNVTYDVVFSDDVTGFEVIDLTFNLAAFEGTIGDISNVVITGSGANYTVTFDISATGSLSVTVDANAAVNGAGSPNEASTSTDNTITVEPESSIDNGLSSAGVWLLALLATLVALGRASRQAPFA